MLCSVQNSEPNVSLEIFKDTFFLYSVKTLFLLYLQVFFYRVKLFKAHLKLQNMTNFIGNGRLAKQQPGKFRDF